jgi:hypothetical protein
LQRFAKYHNWFQSQSFRGQAGQQEFHQNPLPNSTHHRIHDTAGLVKKAQLLLQVTFLIFSFQ